MATIVNCCNVRTICRRISNEQQIALSLVCSLLNLRDLFIVVVVVVAVVWSHNKNGINTYILTDLVFLWRPFLYSYCQQCVLYALWGLIASYCANIWNEIPATTTTTSTTTQRPILLNAPQSVLRPITNLELFTFRPTLTRPGSSVSAQFKPRGRALSPHPHTQTNQSNAAAHHKCITTRFHVEHHIAIVTKCYLFSAFTQSHRYRTVVICDTLSEN